MSGRGSNMMPTIGHVKKKELKKLENEIPANEKELGVDFFIAHSTCDKYMSKIENLNGSWFIKSLCKMVKEHGNREGISSIMSEVENHMQLREYRENDKNLYNMFPTWANRLSKTFKFPKQLEVNTTLSKIKFKKLIILKSFLKISTSAIDEISISEIDETQNKSNIFFKSFKVYLIFFKVPVLYSDANVFVP